MSNVILPSRKIFRPRNLVALSAVFFAGSMIGCEAAPPVQEMSDARQAIAVAIDAGAAQHAASDLLAAENYLKRAEQKLGEQAYNQARIDANEAKERALQALEASEQHAGGK